MGQPEHLHLIAADLGRRELVSVLRSYAFWDLDPRSIVVAEGLLMYLPAEVVRALFRQFISSYAPLPRFTVDPKNARTNPTTRIRPTIYATANVGEGQSAVFADDLSTAVS